MLTLGLAPSGPCLSPPRFRSLRLTSLRLSYATPGARRGREQEVRLRAAGSLWESPGSSLAHRGAGLSLGLRGHSGGTTARCSAPRAPNLHLGPGAWTPPRGPGLRRLNVLGRRRGVFRKEQIPVEMPGKHTKAARASIFCAPLWAVPSSMFGFLSPAGEKQRQKLLRSCYPKASRQRCLCLPGVQPWACSDTWSLFSFHTGESAEQEDETIYLRFENQVMRDIHPRGGALV